MCVGGGGGGGLLAIYKVTAKDGNSQFHDEDSPWGHSQQSLQERVITSSLHHHVCWRRWELTSLRGCVVHSEIARVHAIA